MPFACPRTGRRRASRGLTGQPAGWQWWRSAPTCATRATAPRAPSSLPPCGHSDTAACACLRLHPSSRRGPSAPRAGASPMAPSSACGWARRMPSSPSAMRSSTASGAGGGGAGDRASSIATCCSSSARCAARADGWAAVLPFPTPICTAGRSCSPRLPPSGPAGAIPASALPSARCWRGRGARGVRLRHPARRRRLGAPPGSARHAHAPGFARHAHAPGSARSPACGRLIQQAAPPSPAAAVTAWRARSSVGRATDF